jgi:hypothetical protein
MTEPSLAPREYGAYAELIFPLATGLTMGGATLAGAGFATAALAGFLVSEPLAVLAGARGRRALAQATPAGARRRAVALVLAGLTAGLGALAVAPGRARLAAVVPALLAALLLPTLLRGRQKRLEAELLIAAALSAMLLPVALSGRAAVSSAMLASAVWLLTFWLATLTVHAIKARFKPALGSRWTLWGAPALGVVGVGLAVTGYGAGRVSLAALLAVVPAAIVAGAALMTGVTPRHLRRVGWSLVAANLATFGFLLAG